MGVTAVIRVGVIADTKPPPGEGALVPIIVDGFGTSVLMLILARVRLAGGAGTLEDGGSGTASGSRATVS